MAALGPDEPTEDVEIDEAEPLDDSEVADDPDAAADEAIEAFLDPTADQGDKVAAFRAAVRACMKGY